MSLIVLIVDVYCYCCYSIIVVVIIIIVTNINGVVLLLLLLLLPASFFLLPSSFLLLPSSFFLLLLLIDLNNGELFSYSWDIFFRLLQPVDYWDPHLEATSSGSSRVGAVSGAGSLPMVCWGPVTNSTGIRF